MPADSSTERRMRVGFGYDSHRFATDGAAEDGVVQRLGGVPIRGCPRLVGHSDADVLIHAIVDALLGAAALGDIGSHFPDSDPRWRGADSAAMLRSVVREVGDAGYDVGNVDATVICERPRLRPLADEIRSRLAECLGVPPSRVSVKGKTNEGMDAVGAGLGIEVHAVALLVPRNG